MRQQGKLQRKHVMERYGISRAELDKSIRDESLKFNKQGWANLADVEKWAEAKGHVAIASMVTSEEATGGKLFGTEIVDLVESTNFPEWFIKKVSDASDVSKSLTAAIAAQDKQMKMYRDAGRLGDIREMQAIEDAVASKRVKMIDSLSDEISTEVAKKYKLKIGDVKNVLTEASVYLRQIEESLLVELEELVQAFEDEKSAETKMKARKG